VYDSGIWVVLACATVVCGIGMCYLVLGLVCVMMVSCVSEKNLWNTKLFERLGCSWMHVPVLWLQDDTFQYRQVQASTY